MKRSISEGVHIARMIEADTGIMVRWEDDWQRFRIGNPINGSRTFSAAAARVEAEYIAGIARGHHDTED